MTGQLLRGSPGLAWSPDHHTLLPPIWPPRSPKLPRGGLPVRHGNERLSSSMIPGYIGMYTGGTGTAILEHMSQIQQSSLPPAYPGFVPQAQFIFAKNCSQVWAEALNDITQAHEGQGSQELPKEAKEEKDTEKDQEPNPGAEKEPELEQEAEQVRGEGWGECGEVGVGTLTFWPGVGVAMSSVVMGTGDVDLTASSCSLGARVRHGLNLIALFFFHHLPLTRLPPIPWMTKILASSSSQVRGGGKWPKAWRGPPRS